MGTILATNRTTEAILKSIKRMRAMSSANLIAWNTKVKLDNEEYLKILEKTAYDLSVIIDCIDRETTIISKVLHKLDQGPSLDDINLIANARWIRLNTNFEPLIISDDRDLLTCGHIISSFFGLTLGVLSSFEILRLMKLNEPLIRFCDYYELSINLSSIDDTWSKEALEKDIYSVMKKAKIACHPNLRRNGSLLRIIKN